VVTRAWGCPAARARSSPPVVWLGWGQGLRLVSGWLGSGAGLSVSPSSRTSMSSGASSSTFRHDAAALLRQLTLAAMSGADDRVPPHVHVLGTRAAAAGTTLDAGGPPPPPLLLPPLLLDPPPEEACRRAGLSSSAMGEDLHSTTACGAVAHVRECVHVCVCASVCACAWVSTRLRRLLSWLS
jgi:hypothetical protein